MKRQIQHQILDNLLLAHKGMCITGDLRGVKRLTRYLFRLSYQFDETIMMPPERTENTSK